MASMIKYEDRSRPGFRPPLSPSQPLRVRDGAGRLSYWIPLAGSDELYLRFAADITDWARESLIPQGCEVEADCSACKCE